jgi:hypothetical protein
MEVSGQLHVPAALTPDEAQVTTGLKDSWASYRSCCYGVEEDSSSTDLSATKIVSRDLFIFPGEYYGFRSIFK